MINWKEVQSDWKKREVLYWQEHIRKAGINTWEQFRNPIIKTLKLDKRSWDSTVLRDPLIELPAMYPNPLTRWVDFFGDKKLPRFSEIQEHPFLANHSRIREIADNFPEETTLIILYHKTKEIVLDGHHRACAVDLIYREHKELASNVHIFRSEVSEKEWENITSRSTPLLVELTARKYMSFIQAKVERLLQGEV